MAEPNRPVPRGRLRRTMPLAGFTARAAGGRAVAGLRERIGDAGAVERHHERTAERYAELLGHSKGVLMKAGQMFSMIDTGAVGLETLSPYQRAMVRLQADAPPMAPALAREVIETRLRRRIDDVFADFDDEPVAAASIGQVHRATMPDGRSVAVKVQYPGVAEAIRDDLSNTELLVTCLRFTSATTFGALPDLRAATEEVSTRICEELDYRHEAANVTAFHELFRGHPFIRIPEVVAEVSTDRVLTMTYLDGLDWKDALDADQNLKNAWGETISRMITGAYRHANLFHADPHPGNYKFGLDGTVGFVDFGCVTVLPEAQRRRVIDIVRATVEGRREDLHRAMTDAGFVADGSTLTPDETYRWWSDCIRELLVEQPATYDRATSERAIRALIDLSPDDHPVRRMSVPRDFIFFARINLSMNAILTALNATFDARAQLDDMDGVAAPRTELGEKHCAWVRDRGLPFGTDRHVHP